MPWEQTLKKLTADTAKKAASLWAINPSTLQLINNQINCVYRFEHHGMGYYLRMTHETIRNHEELTAAIDYQSHLFNHQAPVCEPIKSMQGQLIERIEQGDLQFWAHVCREVPGHIMDFETSDETIYFAWGQALAKLHLAAQSYKPQTQCFKTWKDLWEETSEYVKKEDSFIQNLFHSIDTEFKQFKCSSTNYGLTHGDHRPGNVIANGHQVYLIDFDEPVYHWYMADIAKPFLDLCHQPFALWKTKFMAFINGYQSIKAIEEAQLQQLNWFSQMKSLDIYLWCKNNWFEDTAPGGKPREQWLEELRHMACSKLFEL